MIGTEFSVNKDYIIQFVLNPEGLRSKYVSHLMQCFLKTICVCVCIHGISTTWKN